jgi:hypothetical protein
LVPPEPVDDPAAAKEWLEACQAPFLASDDEHESVARKQRVRRKSAVASAFKARRSSRLAEKEAPNFVSVLSKAKAIKASRFDLSESSSRFRAAAEAAGFGGSSDPGPIPLPRLKALAAACGVNPDVVAEAAPVDAPAP